MQGTLGGVLFDRFPVGISVAMSRQTISKLLFSQEQVAGNDSAIYEAVLQGSPNLRRGNFEMLSSSDLAFLFRHYDERVFTGLLQNKLEEAAGTPLIPGRSIWQRLYLHDD